MKFGVVHGNFGCAVLGVDFGVVFCGFLGSLSCPDPPSVPEPQFCTLMQLLGLVWTGLDQFQLVYTSLN